MSKQKSNNGTVFEISADLEFSVVVTIRIPIAFPFATRSCCKEFFEFVDKNLGPFLVARDKG